MSTNEPTVVKTYRGGPRRVVGVHVRGLYATILAADEGWDVIHLPTGGAVGLSRTFSDAVALTDWMDEHCGRAGAGCAFGSLPKKGGRVYATILAAVKRFRKAKANGGGKATRGKPKKDNRPPGAI